MPYQILYFGALAYFLFKMVRMYSPSRSFQYLAARKELTTFAVITILLILCTIVNACMCTNNFNRGLKPFVQRRKVESEGEKDPYTGTEMISDPSGKAGMVPSRMTID